jgi:hypothetical protein
MNFKGLLVTFFMISTELMGQIGGQRVFESLSVPQGGIQSSLGGVNVSSSTVDPFLVYSNPALLEDDFKNRVSLVYSSFVADIGYSSVIFPFQIKDYGNFAAGIQYFSYGSFDGYDNMGNLNGDFSAYDFSTQVSYSRQQGNFGIGLSMKLAHSSIENFNSTALLFDIGTVFRHPTADFNAGLVLKNVGFLFSDYTETSDSELPFDVQAGASFKPEYMPVRFSLTLNNLWKGDIAFFDPEFDDDEPSGFDKFFRHVVIGTEFLISRHFEARFGYNHLVRRELKLENASGGSGFTFGFLARINAFEVGFSRNIFHNAGGNNYFTIAADFNRLTQKKISKTGNLNGDG